MPFDVAFSLEPSERLAFVVALGTLEGRAFDFERMAWREAGDG